MFYWIPTELPPHELIIVQKVIDAARAQNNPLRGGGGVHEPSQFELIDKKGRTISKIGRRNLHEAIIFFITEQKESGTCSRDVPIHVRDELLRALHTRALCQCTRGECQGGGACDERAVDHIHAYMHAYATSCHGGKRTMRVRDGDGVTHTFAATSKPLQHPTRQDIRDGVVGSTHVTPLRTSGPK